MEYEDSFNEDLELLKAEFKNEEITIVEPEYNDLTVDSLYHPCDQCDFISEDSNKLILHQRLVHTTKPTTLPSVVPQSNQTIEKFLERQVKDSLQVCVTPGLGGSQELSYLCELCGKTFPKMFRLKRHVLTVHTDYRPYSCYTCGKNFKEKSHLKTHNKNVHKEISAPCDDQMAQSSLHSFNDEEDSYSGYAVKTECTIDNECELNFDINFSQNKDVAYINPNSNVFQMPNPITDDISGINGQQMSEFFKFSNKKRGFTFCEICHVEFEENSTFVQHRQLSCRICHFQAVDKTALKKHAKCHKKFSLPVSCGKCGMFLKSFTQFKLHHALNHATIFPYKCNMCRRTFQYRSHVLKHKYNFYRKNTVPRITNSKSKTKNSLFEFYSADLSSSNSNTEPFLASVINRDRLYPDNEDNSESNWNGYSYSDLEANDVAYRNDGRKNRCRFASYPRALLCDYCRKPFYSQNDLDNHKFVAPPDRPFKCTQCCKSFKKKGHLTDHVRVHGEASLYQCEDCDKSFKRRAQLVSHIHYTHKNTKRLLCPHCGKVTKSTHGYKAHLLAHTNQRPEVCEICGRSFKSKMHLRSHILSHGENFPFKCELCEMGFREKHRLNRHMLVHADSKPFECDKCDKSYPIKSLLISHLLSHSETTPYNCDYCKKSFKLKKYCDRHVRMMHPC